MADDDLSPFNLNEINLANYDLGEELGTGKSLNHVKLRLVLVLQKGVRFRRLNADSKTFSNF